MNFKKLNNKLFSTVITSFILSTAASCSNSLSNSFLQPDQIDSSSIQDDSSDPTSTFTFGFNLKANTKKAKYDLVSKADVPTKVDLREFCSPIANQGNLGSCTAFAMGKGLREFLLIRDKKPLVPLSPLFLYYNERKIDGDINDDAGSTMTTGMKALKETGDSTEALWPYKTSKFKKEPPPEAYTSGVSYEIVDARNLDGLQAIKDELVKQNPVVFGFDVYSSFMHPKDGLVPVPDIKHEKLLGGHAVMAVGYDDSKGVLIMRNSWGESWGDNGYFYMPYDYFKLSLVEDVWTASELVARRR